MQVLKLPGVEKRWVLKSVMLNYSQVKKAVALLPEYDTEEKKTAAFSKLLQAWRAADKFFSLKGWRNEVGLGHR